MLGHGFDYLHWQARLVLLLCRPADDMTANVLITAHTVTAFLLFFYLETLSNTSIDISGFPRDVDDICGLLGYYAASSGNPLPTFRENVSLPSSRVKKYFLLGLLDP
jgi:hypothetical protein